MVLIKEEMKIQICTEFVNSFTKLIQFNALFDYSNFQKIEKNRNFHQISINSLQNISVNFMKLS